MGIILGSGSPRRLELLRAVGIEPRVLAPDIDESVLLGEIAQEYVRRLAATKLDAVMRSVGAVGVGTIVIAADTTVEIDEAILGKPDDNDQAVAMLRSLSGREHRVHTGLAVAVAGPGCRGVEWQGHVEVVTSRVWFRTLTQSQIADYVATGEPSDKAGAYAIQGGGGLFVDRFDGSLDAIIGLPIERLQEICAGLGQRLG
ncbi:MAG: septum formation protein Maf [Ilumatobacteraceae bacterium]|nr:septum formation protein Maf [Ilumatobacteraceae bacterium]